MAGSTIYQKPIFQQVLFQTTLLLYKWLISHRDGAIAFPSVYAALPGNRTVPLAPLKYQSLDMLISVIKYPAKKGCFKWNSLLLTATY